MHRRRLVAKRLDIAAHGHINRSGHAAGSAIAAQGDIDRSTIATAGRPEGARETTIAAAAADRLGEDTVGLIALGPDLATRVDGHRTGRIAAATAAAQRDADRGAV